MEWETIHTVEDFLRWLSGARETPYRQGLEQARQAVAGLDPATAAKRSGATYQTIEGGQGTFRLPFLGQDYFIGYPDFRVVEVETRKEPSVYRQVILLHYLKTVDDTYVPTGFVNFGGLPHARPYEHALGTSALDPLARAYVDNPNHLRLATQALGGRPMKVEGSRDLVFSFWPLPRLPMGVALMPGDEELSIRAQLLVDVNTEKWLPIYDTAIVGRLLCQTLIRLKPVGGRAVKLSAALVQEDGSLYGAPS